MQPRQNPAPPASVPAHRGTKSDVEVRALARRRSVLIGARSAAAPGFPSIRGPAGTRVIAGARIACRPSASTGRPRPRRTSETSSGTAAAHAARAGEASGARSRENTAGSSCVRSASAHSR